MKRSVPAIPPIADGDVRPLWSVMVPAYNESGYLRETLASVLAQDPGPERMEIQVVDDASPDGDLEETVRSVGDGRVAYRRLPQNVGPTGNFNECLLRARGRLVHVLHGDDLVMPGFYDALAGGASRHPECGAFFTRHAFVDADGHWRLLSPLERTSPGVLAAWPRMLGGGNRIQAPSIVVRREVYETIGGFDPLLVHAADWEMWMRIAVAFPVWYEPAILACYRLHGTSHAKAVSREGNAVADLRRAVDAFRRYLPEDVRGPVEREARRYCAGRAMKAAGDLMAAGHGKAARLQLGEAWRSHPRPRTGWSILRLLLRSAS